MGKTRQGGGGPLPVDYTEQNNKVMAQVCSEKGIGATVKKRVQEILDYCNENNLQLLDSSVYTESEYDKPYFCIIDAESGKQINIFEDILRGKGHLPDGEWKKDLDRTLSVIRNLPDKYVPHIKNINFVKKSGSALGYFNGIYPNSIHLTSDAFKPKGWGGQWETGLTGTIVHEMAHAYDYRESGYCGGLGRWSQMDSYPTTYARKKHEEAISTMMEQVYTKTCRSDAYLKNGRSIKEAFHDKYGYYPKYENGSFSDRHEQDLMYELFEESWAPEVADAKKILFGK